MSLTTRKINNVTPDRGLIDSLSEQLKLNKKLVELLIMRGYNNADAIKVFLNPSVDNLYPPESMLGMTDCCERIEAAIAGEEKVVVYGDYDADGICAAAILSLYLSSRGLNVYTHIPDRLGEGYGLNVDSVERIIDNIMPDLIITCDCGISAVEEVELAKDLGVDIIVTDHHEVGETLPDCVIVNPHQKNCKYPFKDLCGAGVAFKIVQALGGIEAASRFYDLAAIATVADLVKLTDENRLIVQLGLQNIPKSKNFGVLALINDLKLKTVTSSDIAFKIAPRINAAGRMGNAYRAFELFTSDDPTIVADRLKEIVDANNRRKSHCDDLYMQAIAILKHEDLVTKRAIVISSDTWEKGITGILAARLVGDFKRPTFILVKNGDEYKGTCRSIEGINIYELLSKNADILKEFGGHTQAAGFTIREENVPVFKERIYEMLADIDPKMFIPSLTYDMELGESDLTGDFARALDMLEPTGNNGNPKPVFMTRTPAITAAPLKNNAAHTILRSQGGSQFFAYNAYKLNAYYNGNTEREILYEIADGGEYSPRLYLRGASIKKLAVSDSLAKAGYLRMLNYGESKESPIFKTYTQVELDSLIDYPFGILLICGCKATYEKFAEKEHDNVVVHEFFSETSVNVYTRLIVSPEFDKSFMLENYKRVIFLDSPPSNAVIGYINRHTDAEVYVPEYDNRSEMFDNIRSDRTTFGKYFGAIKSNADIKAANVYAYFKTLRERIHDIELPQFIVCLSVFTQLGLMKFKNDSGIILFSCQNPLENSAIYRTIHSWRK